jgi:hypothetical protein
MPTGSPMRTAKTTASLHLFRASFALSTLVLVAAIFSSSTLWAAEAGPDLPPTGASMFDLYVAQLGGVDALPKNFQNLREDLQAKSLDPERPQNSLLIPFGRSLQKPLSLEPSPLVFPRVVVAMGSQVRDPLQTPRGRLNMKSRLYVGYHEPKEQIEVISWNERVGRFEFQIVKNYGPGKKAKIAYAPRSLCMTCHLGGGPIFPIAPWAELNADISMAALIQRARSHSGDSSGFYQGVQIQDDDSDRENFPRTRKGTAQLFENTVFNAERLLRSQKYWSELCGELNNPAQCRRQLVTSAALVHLARMDDLEIRDVQPLAPGRAQIAVADFQFHDPLLRPRAPVFDLAQSLNLQTPFSIEGARKHIEALFVALSPGLEDFASASIQKIQELFLVSKLPAEEDPQTSRLQPLDADLSSTFSMAVHAVGMAVILDNDRELRSEFQLFPEPEDGSEVSFTFQRTEQGFKQIASSFGSPDDAELRLELLAQSSVGSISWGQIIATDKVFTLQCLESEGGKIFCRNISFVKLLNRLETIDPEFFERRAIPDRLIVAHLLNRPRDDQEDLYARVSPPEELGHESLDTLIPKLSNKKLKLTMESCGRCHFGSDSVAPTLFEGESEFELFESVRKNAEEMSIRFLRAKKPMPPQKSPEFAHISADAEKTAELRAFIEMMRLK